MPTISVYEDDVKAELGDILLNYGSKQDLVKSFDELCFNFGLELDEVTSEYEMFKKERGMILSICSLINFRRFVQARGCYWEVSGEDLPSRGSSEPIRFVVS
jgi:hypothetical protein